jgi:hypothetical protein
MTFPPGGIYDPAFAKACLAFTVFLCFGIGPETATLPEDFNDRLAGMDIEGARVTGTVNERPRWQALDPINRNRLLTPMPPVNVVMKA